MVEDVAEVSIRAATPEDAKSIARVHIASWREAHTGIVSADLLARLDLEQRTEQWRDVIAGTATSATRVWVAEDAGDAGGTAAAGGAGDRRVLGFASLGPSRDEDADRSTLEIYTIYLEPDAWGHGVARKLMRTVLDAVPEGSTVTLWVVAANERAQHFYRRNGFVADGVERLEELGGEQLREIRWVRG